MFLKPDEFLGKIVSASIQKKLFHPHNPVSYTHLDVYKRQGEEALYIPGHKKPTKAQLARVKALKPQIIAELKRREAEKLAKEAVSYTHLDVYKRQVFRDAKLAELVQHFLEPVSDRLSCITSQSLFALLHRGIHNVFRYHR